MEDEKKPDPGKEQKSGLPRIQAKHVIIAVAVIVLAIIFIAKFGYNTDLISTSSGEMAIAKLRPVTPVQTLVQNPVVKPTISFRPEMLCSGTQTACADGCTDTTTDLDNCGACGKVCTRSSTMDRHCSQGTCSYTCLRGYLDCNENSADGCEIYVENDDNNCGACGKVCGDGSWCTGFACRDNSTFGKPGSTYNPPQRL